MSNNQKRKAWIDSDGVIHHATDEPDFVKLYYEHLSFVVGLAKNDHNILYKLLTYMGYDHSIFITLGMKKVIAVELGISSHKVIEQSIKRIVDSNILAKERPGHYIVNPFLLAKGSWDAVKDKQKKGVRSIKFGLDYCSNGIKLSVEKN